MLSKLSVQHPDTYIFHICIILAMDGPSVPQFLFS